MRRSPGLSRTNTIRAKALRFTDLHTAFAWITYGMSTADLIFKKAKALPSPLQTEALHFVDYLLTRQEARTEAAAWAKFSTGQLENQYAATDSIYDQELLRFDRRSTNAHTSRTFRWRSC